MASWQLEWHDEWVTKVNRLAIALTLHQVFWVMQYLDGQWVATCSREERHELAAAAVTHLFGWLGWLRSQELFSLTWGDIKVTGPADGPRIGLAPGIGAIELRLLPETKSSRTKVADVIISYLCASGLAPRTMGGAPPLPLASSGQHGSGHSGPGWTPMDQQLFPT
jgi:hypothetical protein